MKKLLYLLRLYIKNNNFKKLKKTCVSKNVDLSYVAYSSFLIIELEKSFKPTIEQIDDLYYRLIGRIFRNFDNDKQCIYMDGIGSLPETKNSFEDWKILRDELIYEFGIKVHPYKEWIKNNKESNEWAELISSAKKIDKKFKKNPEIWIAELKKCVA